MNHYSYAPYAPYAPYDYYVGASQPAASFFNSSMLTKAAIVAGGALAIYLIFQISKSAEKLEPVHRGVGRLAGKAARARYGGKASALLAGGGTVGARLGSGSRGSNYSSDSLLGGADSYKLLTA